MVISRLLSFIVAAVILIGSGMAYGLLAEDSEKLDQAADRVPRVPMEIGDWRAMAAEDDDADERSFEQTGAKGYWIRTYVHQHTRVSIRVILMCGRAGKMAVHTPDVCYGGAGYDLLDQPKVCVIRNELGDELSRFWTGNFVKRKSVADSIRLYWGWTPQGTWEASGNPRWQYRGEPFLFKMYVSRNLGGAAPGPAEADPTESFLSQFVPELKQALFPEEQRVKASPDA